MKANYKPWEVKIEDFHKQSTEADKLKFLLNFAVLAPSSHNSQPWKFGIKDRDAPLARSILGRKAEEKVICRIMDANTTITIKEISPAATI